MAGEVSVAREGGVSSLNAVSGSSRRQANPFRDFVLTPLSDLHRRHLESEGVNMQMYEAMRRDNLDRRIDEEYEEQVTELKMELREKYPLGNYANSEFTNDPELLAQAKQQRASYNLELNRGIKRLRRLAKEAKKK